MNRRELLQVAALLAAGTSTLPAGLALSKEQSAFLAAQPSFVDRERPDFFTDSQRAAVNAASEQIIPRTDSPGAIDAGVGRFIELMVSDWFTAEERRPFMDGLADLQSRAGGDFAALSGEQQLQLLEALEDEFAESDWYQLGNIFRVWDFTVPFICQLKELTVLGFFLSEAGATQTLRQNPMGNFKGDLPLGEDDTSYATGLPVRNYFFSISDRS